MSIEGIPLITRFKTFQLHIGLAPLRSIEGIPLITRFKTFLLTFAYSIGYHCIEGIPLITRFKTQLRENLIFHRSCIEGIPLITRFKTIPLCSFMIIIFS